MALHDWWDTTDAQAGAPGFRSRVVPLDQWRAVAEDFAAASGHLLALWASADHEGTPMVRAALVADARGLVVSAPVAHPERVYPSLTSSFPCALRMERAIADLTGLRSDNSDTRPWLRHAVWPEGYRPLLDGPHAASGPRPIPDDYSFVRVDGDGVHEIAVGPVHAGIIEPGHFRFSVVGEKVLRLEERLGYVHKGIEQRFTQLAILEGHRLAARVSGDSSVAFSWAYCQALEGMAGAEIPPRATWLRALCLELERLSNHLGDLGALGNDAGFAFGLVQFSRLKEGLLRTIEEAFGQRYLMDAIEPGGTRVSVTPAGIAGLRQYLHSLAAEVLILRVIYDEHAGLRDRFTGAGVVSPDLAARLGLTGLAGRSSGVALDLRTDLPCAPYTHCSVKKAVRLSGDVAARVAVRFEELEESCRLIQHILTQVPDGPHRTSVRAPADGTIGLGLIEAWRGPVCVALEAGPEGTIRRCHPHDPSWQNWPVLEHAIIDNIVPDFPLINKSFNLSYSGHDL